MATNVDVVTRTITVPGLHQGKTMADIIAALRERQGVIDLSIDPQRDSLRISYDVKQLLFGDVEKTLSSLGVPLSLHGWMRLKACWYRFTDENARANANAKGGACCSNPTEIYSRRHKRG